MVITKIFKPIQGEGTDASDYAVLIETSGKRFVAVLPRGSSRSSPWTAHSGEAGRFDIENLEAVDRKDEIKFVLASRCDYDSARDFIERHSLAERVPQILFSPVVTDPPVAGRD